MNYLLPFILFTSYACQPFTNKVSELALDCGPDAKKIHGEFIKLEDPNGQTPDPDSIEALEVDINEKSITEARIPITSRSCVVLPDQNSKIIVLRSADNQRNWGFVAKRNSLSFLKTIRLKKLIDRSIELRCPKEPIKEIRPQFALIYSENVDNTELFIQARSLKTTPNNFSLTLAEKNLTIESDLSEGEHHIEFSIYDLVLNSPKEAPTKKLTCSIKIDRTHPKLNLDSVFRTHKATIPSGSNIPLKTIDENPKFMRYCLSEPESQTCLNSLNWTTVSNSEVSLEAPSRGIWKLAVEAIDAAGNSTVSEPFELRISQKETVNNIRTLLSTAQIAAQSDTLQAQVNILRAFKEYDELVLDEEKATIKAHLLNKALAVISSYHENFRVFFGKDSSIASNDSNQKSAWIINSSKISWILADGAVLSSQTFDFGEKPSIYVSKDNNFAAVIHENSKKMSVFHMSQGQIQHVGTISDHVETGIMELRWLGDSHSLIVWNYNQQETLASIYHIEDRKLSLKQKLPKNSTSNNSQEILFHKESGNGNIIISYESGALSILKLQENGIFALQNKIISNELDNLVESIKTMAIPRPFIHEQKNKEGGSDFYFFASEEVFIWKESTPNIISQVKLNLEDLSSQEKQCFKSFTVNSFKFEEFFKKVPSTENRYLSKCEKVGWFSLYLDQENVRVSAEFALSMPSSAANASRTSKEYFINDPTRNLKLVQILDQTQVNIFDLKNSNGFLSFQKQLSFSTHSYEVIYPNMLGRDFIARDIDGYLRFVSLSQPQSKTIPSSLSSLTWRQDNNGANILVTSTDTPTIKTWSEKGELLKTYSIQSGLLPASPMFPSLDWSADGKYSLVSFPWGQLAVYSKDNESAPIIFPKLPDITESSASPEADLETQAIKPIFKAIGNRDFSKIFAITGSELAIWKKSFLSSSSYELEQQIELIPYEDSESSNFNMPRRYEARWIEKGSQSILLVSHGSRLQNIDFFNQNGERTALISNQDDLRASILDRSGSTLIVQRKGGKLSAIDLTMATTMEIALEGLPEKELIDSFLFSSADDQLFAITSNENNRLTLHTWSRNRNGFKYKISRDIGQKTSIDPKHLEWSQALGGLVLLQESSSILGLNSNLEIGLKIPTISFDSSMRTLLAANPHGSEIVLLNPQGNFVLVYADFVDIRQKFCTSIRGFLENIADEDWLLDSDRKLCE